MLGGEQSGHIEAVGFEMYTSMLEHAVNELKGEEHPERPVTQLNLGISLRIDETYIPEENQRLRIYKKIAGAAGRRRPQRCARGDRRPLRSDCPPAWSTSRGGGAAPAGANSVGVSQVDRKRDQLLIRFTGQAHIDPGRLMKLVAQNASRARNSLPRELLRVALKSHRPARNSYRNWTLLRSWLYPPRPP